MTVQSLGAGQGVAYDASAEITFDMQPGVQYRVMCSTVCWLQIAKTGTAAVKQAAGTHFIPANTPVLVGCLGAANRCSFIKDTTAGWAHLSEVAHQT